MRGILKHDFYSGILSEWKKFIFGIILFALIGVCAGLSARSYEIRALSLFETAEYVMLGVVPFQNVRGNTAIFHIPVVWLIVQIFIAYMIGSYPEYDLKNYGINLLLRTHNRAKWWYGKAVWAILLNVIIYGCQWGTFAVIAQLKGADHLLIQKSVAELCHVDLSGYRMSEQLFLILIMPLLTSIALSMIQMCVLVWKNGIAAYVVILFLCCAGAYYETPFCIADNSMVTRTAVYFQSGSLPYVVIGLVLCIVCCLAAGKCIMEHKDIYGN